jgi:hypothetical protein
LRTSDAENTLRFLDHHHARHSAEFTAQELADQTWRLSSSGYDARGRILTLRELRDFTAELKTLAATTESIHWKSERENPDHTPMIGVLLNGTQKKGTEKSVC